MSLVLLLACTSPGEVPPTRYSHVGALAGEGLYITGGSSEQGKRLDAWRFDLPSGSWEQLGAPPEPIFRATATLDGGRALVFGGSSTDNIESDRLYAWDLDGDSWTPLDSGPSGRYKAAAVAFEGGMFLQGGRQDDSGETLTLGDTWVFDGLAWTELSTLDGPGALTRQALAWDGQRIWLQGGIDQDGERHDWLWSLEPGSWQWTQHSWEGDGPGVRASHSLVFHGGQLYVWGGNADDDAVWVYDIAAGSWSALTDEGPGRRDAQVTALDPAGLLYIMGGDPYAEHGVFLNDVWVLDLGAGQWRELHPGS